MTLEEITTQILQFEFELRENNSVIIYSRNRDEIFPSSFLNNARFPLQKTLEERGGNIPGVLLAEYRGEHLKDNRTSFERALEEIFSKPPYVPNPTEITAYGVQKGVIEVFNRLNEDDKKRVIREANKMRTIGEVAPSTQSNDPHFNHLIRPKKVNFTLREVGSAPGVFGYRGKAVLIVGDEGLGRGYSVRLSERRVID